MAQQHPAAMDPAQAIEFEAMANHGAVKEAILKGDSDIQKFYRGATILVTGGSGFLGKQLVEKLFRACDIKKLFLLLRPKKEKHIKERLHDILKEAVYDSVREFKPDFANNITCMEGDMAVINLGLNSNDWTTLASEVEVIFHVAATTRFDQCLRDVTLINVRGTREVMALANSCKKLRAVVYVSTAYSHATSSAAGKSIFEQFYPSPVSPEIMIQLAENLSSQKLESISHQLTEGWPNNYTFTKAIAEDLVRQSSHLPICIIRPSIVTAAHSEPTPGWIDISSVYSASGLVIGFGLGITHVMLTHPKNQVSLVPVDFVNNATIAAAWEVGTRQHNERETTIYNVVMSQNNTFNSARLLELFKCHSDKIPTPSAVWKTFLITVECRILYNILIFFLHTVPAYIMDLILFLTGKRRKFVKLYKKLHKMTDLISYFLYETFRLESHNSLKLYEKLSETDKVVFNFDMRTVDWYEYTRIWGIGVRRHILKDGLKDTELARRKQTWFKYMNYIVMSLYICVICYVFYKIFNFLTVLMNYLLSALINN